MINMSVTEEKRSEFPLENMRYESSLSFIYAVYLYSMINQFLLYF